ncbi:hypothetical protein BH23CHL5_BH23CHL5_23480 [soil metagenome]
MHVLIGEISQEVSTFNPAASHVSDFTFSHGSEVLDFHDGKPIEIGAAMQVFRESGVQFTGTFSARAITSAGTLGASDWDAIARDFLSALAKAPKADGIYFSMHGAMCAENEFDPEGYLLQETRKIVGEQIPIVVSLDLHGILTNRMLEHSDAVVVYHTYPHNDFSETGARAARLLLRILNDGAKPVTAMVRIPALVRGDEMITETGIIGPRIRECRDIEASNVGLSAGMFWGNPFTDVPDLSSNSLVVLDGDESSAAKFATELAFNFWADRAAMQAPLVSVAEAVAQSRGATGAVVLIDAADAPSSGASGDSNVILREILESAHPW